jgi:hypothetical protein
VAATWGSGEEDDEHNVPCLLWWQDFVTAGIIDSIIAVGLESSKQVCNKQIGNKFACGQQQGQ